MASRARAGGGDMLQGALDMLILRSLVHGPAHGHTIAHAIEHGSDRVLQVEHGSLYPALHRLEERGLVASFWGTSENNRKASTTAPGLLAVGDRAPGARPNGGACDRAVGGALAGAHGGDHARGDTQEGEQEYLTAKLNARPIAPAFQACARSSASRWWCCWRRPAWCC